jgi:C1A family cysteine protease
MATTAAIESLYRIKTGRSIRLSTQLLVDCDKTNRGCEGGSARKAFRWIVGNGGITSQSEYPFVAQRGTCNQAKKSKHDVKITGFAAVRKTEGDLMRAVVQQPVVAGLFLAKIEEFKNYSGGIFEGPCGDYKHGVTVVGYGASDKGVPFWIVKNSYGTSWGDKGYMYVRRGVRRPGGVCGIANIASYPLM